MEIDGYKECMSIIKKWERISPVEIKKTNTAAEDMLSAAVETIAAISVITLIWLLVTITLYF